VFHKLPKAGMAEPVLAVSLDQALHFPFVLIKFTGPGRESFVLSALTITYGL